MKSLVEAEDRQFERELNDLHVSGAISRAALASDPSFAAGKAEANPDISPERMGPPIRSICN